MESCKHAFRFRDVNVKVIILVYVNDPVIITLHLKHTKMSKKELPTLFKLTEQGELSYYLGVSFKRIGNKMLPSQTACGNFLLQRLRVKYAKPISTLMVRNMDEYTRKSVLSEDEKEKGASFSCRSLISSLLYLRTHTKSDAAFSFARQTSFIGRSTPEHVVAGKRFQR